MKVTLAPCFERRIQPVVSFLLKRLQCCSVVAHGRGTKLLVVGVGECEEVLKRWRRLRVLVPAVVRSEVTLGVGEEQEPRDPGTKQLVDALARGRLGLVVGCETQESSDLRTVDIHALAYSILQSGGERG